MEYRELRIPIGVGIRTFWECHFFRSPWGPERDYDEVAWSPDGSEVYFTQGGDIYGVTSDGWRLRPIARVARLGGDYGPRRRTSFAVAPDGMSVVFAGCLVFPPSFQSAHGTRVDTSRLFERFNFELLSVPLNATGVGRLTGNTSFDFYPAWSPDGQRIAYLTDFGRSSASSMRDRVGLGLFTMAADGTDVRPVLDLGFSLLPQPPQWSPDGKHLAVVRYRQATGRPYAVKQRGRELYVVRADGAEPRRLATDVVSAPSWSPDGTRLAYARAERKTGGVGLYTVGKDGTNATRQNGILQWRGPNWKSYFEGRPGDESEAWIDIVAWSPDGSRILVGSNPSHPAFVVELETGRRTHLGIHALEGVRAAAWSPDGSRIALTAFGDSEYEGPQIVATVAADGTDLRVLAERDPRAVSLFVQGGARCPDPTMSWPVRRGARYLTLT